MSTTNNTQNVEAPEDHGECAICKETIVLGSLHEDCTCHNFHALCLAEWIQRSSTCPICRRGIYETAEEPQSDSDNDEHEPTQHEMRYMAAAGECISVDPRRIVKYEMGHGRWYEVHYNSNGNVQDMVFLVDSNNARSHCGMKRLYTHVDFPDNLLLCDHVPTDGNWMPMVDSTHHSW